LKEKDLVGMSVEDLIALRENIDATLKLRLSDAKRDLQDKLSKLERFMDNSAPKPRGVKKGTTVEPKYRGPDGETWAGRGARPKWMLALLKKGRKPEDFLISKARKKAA
jgi:DNA-binding protein H-NS